MPSMRKLEGGRVRQLVPEPLAEVEEGRHKGSTESIKVRNGVTFSPELTRRRDAGVSP
jgi:hypothetical protein